MITARIVITALAGLTLVLLAACRPSVASDPASTAPATVQFIVPVAGSLANLPMYIARTQGFWKKQNITMELVAARGGGPDLAAVAAGEVQFDVSAGTYVGVASGAPIIAVMNVNKRSIANVVIRKELADQLGVSMSAPLDKRIAALNNLKIGISTPGSFFDIMYGYYVEKGGLKGTTAVPVGAGPTALAALRAKTVDALIYSSPVIEQAIAGGDAVMILQPSAGKGDAPQFEEFFMTQLIVNKKYLADNPAVVKRVVAGMVEASEWIQSTDASKIAEVLVTDPDFNGVDAKLLASAIETTKGIINTSGCTSEQTIANSASTWPENARNLKFADLVTNDYLPKPCPK